MHYIEALKIVFPLQDFVTCGLQNLRIPNNFNLNVDLLDWFYMNPYTCLLTLRQSLVSLGASVVEMDVRATDDGIPPRTSQGIARITINIFRNENDPFFVTTPYVTTIPETTEIGTNVITVSARDTDDLVS